MASANFQIAVKGIDKTGAAFDSIRNRARVTGAQIRAIMGGAIAAAGTYLSARAVKTGIEDLGKMSDLARKAGTSVEFLDRTSQALSIAGINMGAEQLAATMRSIQKATGEIGEHTFWDTVKAISAIPDPAKRSAEATRLLGQSSTELLPLIMASDDVRQRLQQMTTLFPAVSSSAAKAGKEFDAAQRVLARGFTTLWLNVLGKILGIFGEKFPGGVLASSLSAANYFDYALRRMYNRAVYWGSRIGLALQAWNNYLFNGYTWEAAGREHSELIRELDKELNTVRDKLDQDREEFKKMLRTLSVSDLLTMLGLNDDGRRDRGETPKPDSRLEKTPAQERERVPEHRRISNELMVGGSAAANRLAILGPEYQNEQREQTKYLKRLVELEEQRDEAPTVELAESDL